MTEAVKQGRATIASLQAVRFFAALLVVLDHVRIDGAELAARLGIPFVFPAFSGRLGVEIFFLISGFIMVYITAGERGWSIGPGRFLAERAIRIVPGYWAATIAIVMLGAAAAQLNPAGEAMPWSAGRYLTSFLFIPHFDPDYGLRSPILYQGWTLNYEMFFYALFAIALCFSRRRGLVLLAATLAALAACGMAIDRATGQPPFLALHEGILLPILRFWMHPIILLFLAGTGLAVAREQVAARWGLPRFRHAAAASFALIAAFSGADMLLGLPAAARLAFAGAIVALCCLTAEPDEGGWARAALVRGGDASYSLYLFHAHVLLLCAAAWRRTLGSGASLYIFAVLAVIACIGAALAAHALFEKPVSRLLRRFTDAARRRDAVPFAARW